LLGQSIEPFCPEERPDVVPEGRLFRGGSRWLVLVRVAVPSHEPGEELYERGHFFDLRGRHVWSVDGEEPFPIHSPAFCSRF
ncbi:MAG: hypothetical protein KC416_17530, partial [Myxococcales bacterium]|nr:hypothetical protein [Myxococcales bacterium]